MKNTLKKIFSLFNLEINRRPISEIKKRQWIRDANFKTILDIGANQGYFAKEMRALLPNAQIHCFEPLPDCFKALVQHTQTDHFIAVHNIGFGEHNEQRFMYQNSYSPSSSLLEIADLHIRNFPQTQHTFQTQVEIRRLDDYLKDVELPMPLFVKIDVQGFEDKVILGGKNILQKADAILVELSFVPLYHHQPLFHDIYELLIDLGFEFRGAFHQLFDAKNGNVLQMDGIFIKKS